MWSPVKAWMFLRMENDVVIERTVAAGELVQLPGRPSYLAIGAGDAELTIGITPVDVSKFVQGTLRMGVAEFSLAEQNALGGSIPDPAGALSALTPASHHRIITCVTLARCGIAARWRTKTTILPMRCRVSCMKENGCDYSSIALSSAVFATPSSSGMTTAASHVR